MPFASLCWRAAFAPSLGLHPSLCLCFMDAKQPVIKLFCRLVPFLDTCTPACIAHSPLACCVQTKSEPINNPTLVYNSPLFVAALTTVHLFQLRLACTRRVPAVSQFEPVSKQDRFPLPDLTQFTSPPTPPPPNFLPPPEFALNHTSTHSYSVTPTFPPYPPPFFYQARTGDAFGTTPEHSDFTQLPSTPEFALNAK